MDLKDLKRHWHAFGKRDPFFAVLTDSRFKDNRWRADEFFRTGDAWIGELLANLEKLGVEVGRERCLDFGCGVGRLTQALCGRFELCDGVDIAPSMIELARKYNRYADRCRYHVNDAHDLRIFSDASFDFVCSLLVLQHIEPRYTKNYIAEFVRVLKPGGIAAFQLPSAVIHPKSRTLPASAYRARIVAAPTRLTTRAGQPLTLTVTVRNESDVTWPRHPSDRDDFARLRLGNHWLDTCGTMLRQDDGRTDLPDALDPGQELVLPLTITPPGEGGDYLLQLDLVEEGVTWFANRGVDAPTIEVHNRPANSGFAGKVRAILRSFAGRPAESPADEESNPVMEMHWVPRDEVVSIVAGAGGRVLHQIDNDWAGGCLDSVLYVATRIVRN
jgi:SAM-dependent methyltransferase